MLSKTKMSKNKIPLFFPMFQFVVFYDGFQWLCQYTLKPGYTLLATLGAVYSKRAHSELAKFNKFLLKAFSTHWMRVSFRGKGYRLRKFKKFNKVTLNFGHSHWAKLALITGRYFFKKIRRQNYICTAKSYIDYKLFKNDLKFFKALNVYTKRGLRLRKQFIRKRFGKISQVVSSLH